MSKESFRKALLQILKNTGSFAGGILAGEPFDYLDLRLRGQDPSKIRKGFYNMRLRRYIVYDKGKYTFTQKGKAWINKNKARYFKIASGNWDHKWRIVIF